MNSLARFLIDVLINFLISILINISLHSHHLK